MALLSEFSDGLRPGAFDSYEKYVLGRVKQAAKLVIKSKDNKELTDAGLANPFAILAKALQRFATDVEAKTLLEDLEKWFSSMKGLILQGEIAELIEKALSGSTLDIDNLDEKLKQLKGTKLEKNVGELLFALVPQLFQIMSSQACGFFFPG